MKPETFLGIALELIGLVTEKGSLPADARVGRLFRQKRFLGSKDRRLLGEAVYSWLRHVPRARARWTSWAHGPGGDPARASLLEGERSVHLLDVLALAADGLFPAAFAEVAGAAGALSAHDDGKNEKSPEAGFIRNAIETAGWPGPDAWPADPLDRFAAELSLPRWLAERLSRERGDEGARSLARALLHQAPVGLRVRLRRISREEARRTIEEETGAAVELTPFSPAGLRLARRRNLTCTRASREAWVEVEDEGSQIVALALDAAPGMDIIDACAGAGGKTLAIADGLLTAPRKEKGTLTACDVSPAKLEELARRARDAGILEKIRIVPIAAGGPLPALVQPADLVLVDAPCSGLGTLRRNPELKLRWTPDDIATFAKTQRGILERFLPAVRKGGRIAYATCSILAEENEDVAAAFSGAHPELEPAPSEWAAARLPPRCLDGNRIRIDPASTGTDGFFVAIWRRGR